MRRCVVLCDTMNDVWWLHYLSYCSLLKEAVMADTYDIQCDKIPGKFNFILSLFEGKLLHFTVADSYVDGLEKWIKEEKKAEFVDVFLTRVPYSNKIRIEVKITGCDKTTTDDILVMRGTGVIAVKVEPRNEHGRFSEIGVIGLDVNVSGLLAIGKCAPLTLSFT